MEKTFLYYTNIPYMASFTKLLLNLNTSWKVKAIAPYLHPGEKILDFGCGDLSLAIGLSKKISDLHLTGIDTEKFLTSKPKNIKAITYNGKKLPFADNAFDTVISVYVFHHTRNAKYFYGECLRVAAKKVIFIEAVARKKYEIPFMKIVDNLSNVWKKEKIAKAEEFYTLREWENILKNKGNVTQVKDIPTITSLLPIGKGYLFIVSKKSL